MSTNIQHVYIHLICNFEHRNITVQPHQSSILLRKINRTFFFYAHQNPGLLEAKCNFLNQKILRNIADSSLFIIISAAKNPKDTKIVSAFQLQKTVKKTRKETVAEISRKMILFFVFYGIFQDAIEN